MDLVWLQGFKQIRVSTFYSPLQTLLHEMVSPSSYGMPSFSTYYTIVGAWTHAMAEIQISNFAITGLKILMPEV